MATSHSKSYGANEDHQHKANAFNQSREHAINGSNRVFGHGASSGDRGKQSLMGKPRPFQSYHYSNFRAYSPPRLSPTDLKYRDLSRSPSPYRRRRTRSPSPYRSKRIVDRSPSPYRNKRTTDRSPSPYRKRRSTDRSPSPFRHIRAEQAGRGRDFHESRPYQKRRASPPHDVRPDKRQHADRGRGNRQGNVPGPHEWRAESNHSGVQQGPRNGPNRSFGQPLSYAGLEKPSAVPQFRDGAAHSLQAHDSIHNDRKGNFAWVRASAPTGSSERQDVKQDVEMKTIVDDTDYILEPVKEVVPTEESREEKRRRWAALRAAAEQEKSKENLLHQAILGNATLSNVASPASPASYVEASVSPSNSPQLGNLDSVPASPDVMIVDKQDGQAAYGSPAADSPSAADYDPLQDMLADRNRAADKAQKSDLPSDAYQETDPAALSTLPAEKIAPVKKQKKEIDMFASDDDEDEDEDVEEEIVKGTVLDEKLLDNWDDPEGYYKVISNELINNGRYRVIKNLGKGVFANVAQAEDVSSSGSGQGQNLVAVKMIRRNDLMRKASQKEMDFLRKVNEEDPQDKRHIIRLLGSFDHKGHLCIVFEHMSKNLRDLLKEETNGHGLAINAVRVYARQMFLGLQHLQNCQVIHLDLKPDNILVSADKKTIKLADFGTAVDKRDIIERTEYMVSRFYRAPEIILGMDIGFPVDTWAIGCTIYELWTGKILFTGRSNNQMVKSFMDCLGWPSEKLLKKGLLNNVLEHFEPGPPLKFVSREIDKNNKLYVRKIEQQKKAARDMKTRVHEAARDISGGPTVLELNDLTDLLNASLHMNVEKRITPKEALNHKFLANKILAPKPTNGKSAVVKPRLLKRGQMAGRH